MTCNPVWRCLRYDCSRCSRDRDRSAKRAAERRAVKDFIRSLADRKPITPDDPTLN